MPFDQAHWIPVAQKILNSELERRLLGVGRPLLGLDDASLEPPKLWFGVTSYYTPTHADPADNLVLQISGQKRVWLSPPTSYGALQPTCVAEQCWANATFGAFARSAGASTPVAEVLRRVQAVNLTLSAGELLYLPAGWFHCVANLEPTVMVNVWTRGQERVGVP